MSDPVSAARTARENLARGLGALQAPGVPPSTASVAEPIAQAMGALHRIESTQGAAVAEAGPAALDAARRALALLQAQPPHPAVDQAMEAIAGSLSLVHGLTTRPAVAAAPPIGGTVALPPDAGAAPWGGAPQWGAQAPAAPQPAPAAHPQTATQPVPVQPQWGAPAAPQFAPAPAPAAPAYAPPPAAGPAYAPPPAAAPPAVPPQPFAAPPQPFAPPPQPFAPPPGQPWAPPAAAAGPVAQAPAAPPAPQWGAPPPAAPQWQPPMAQPPMAQPPMAQPPMAQPPVAQPPMAHAATAPAWAPQAAPAAAAPPVDGAVLRIQADLGAHSATNFYKGLAGNDVIDSGGLFVATYQIPSIGQHVLLKVSLPGGYEFETRGIVRWTREAPDSGGHAPPGFGAQLVDITPEGRQLVYRYVRNREPLFHDDL